MSKPSTGNAHSRSMLFCMSMARIVRCVLVVIFLIQSALIGVLHYHKDIPVPDFFLQQLHLELEEQGIRFTSKSIKVDLSGELLIKDAKFYHEDFREPLIAARSAMAEFSVLHLIIGQLSIDRIRISDATLLCPGLYSPTGVAEKALDNIFLDLTFEPAGWEIHNLQLQSGPLQVSVQGQLPRYFLSPKTTDTTPAEDLDLSAQLHQSLGQLESWISQRQKLEYLKHPTIRIELQSQNRESLMARVEIHSLGTAHPEGIETGPLFGHLVLGFKGHWFLQGKRSYVMTEYVRWKDKLETGTLYAQFSDEAIPLHSWIHLLPNIEIHTHTMNTHGLQLSTMTAKLLHYEDTLLQLEASIRKQQEHIHLEAAINPKTQSGTILLDAYWNPKTLLDLHWIQPSPIFDRFKIPDTPSIQASLNIGPGFSIENIDFAADFSRVAYRDIDLIHLLAQGNYANNTLNIEQVQLVSEEYAVAGSYWQNLDTQDYRFLLEGTIDPTDLNSVIQEKWWLDLWPRFTFHSQLPYCNIDLRGRYFGGAPHRRIFAFNRFKDTSFQGTRLQEFTGYLIGLPESIRLHQLKAEGYQGGETDIDVQWDYRNGPTSKYMTMFQGYSSLPLNDAARMIGQETVDFVTDFELTDLPQIKACGIIYGKNSDRAGEEFLNIRGQVDQPVSYRNVRFDSLNFSAFKNSHYVRLRNIQLGLGQGIAVGKLDVFLKDDQQDVHLVADLKRAQYRKIVEAMPTVFDASTQDASGEQPQTPTHIDLELRGSGPFEDIWKFSGEGRIQIYDTDFGRLHLMGAFSRYIYKVAKFNFGSLKFNHAESTFSFEDGVFSFPDVRISGPTGRINASGQLKLPEEELDFDILLAPFSEVETPVLSQLLYVFNPLANTLGAELRGTIDDPVYDIDFKPLKALTGTNRLKPPASKK